MLTLLSKEQQESYEKFRSFVKEHVEPFASSWDKQQVLPRSIVSQIGEAGFFGCSIPKENGGQGMDFVTFGLLNEAFGRGSSSLTDLFTIQAMVSLTLAKWGTSNQKKRWIKPIADGEIIAAFALTEPNVGSDLKGIETTFSESGKGLILQGSKKWISYGETADLFLVFGTMNGKSIACLVPKTSPGIKITPLKEMMGFKAAHLAQVDFTEVEVALDNVVGKPGFAFSHIAPIGLQYGRISTSCSALGLLRGCLEESIEYASERKVSGKSIGNFGMIRSMLAKMGTDLEAASLLCYTACKAEDERLTSSFERVLMAKYFTSKAVVQAASDAVQIRGASGCNESSSVARFYRDAKVMEIIEGTTQIHERLLGKCFLDRVGSK